MVTRIRRLLLGLTGSSALLSLLPEFIQMRGSLVQEYAVMMTPSAVRMISPLLVGSALGANVYVDSMTVENSLPVHRAIPPTCDAALIAPATLNTLSSLAYGSTDNVLTLSLANFSGPTGLIPTLNTEMSGKPATKRIMEQLRMDGFLFAAEEDFAASDLSGTVQRGVSKHELRKLMMKLTVVRDAGQDT